MGDLGGEEVVTMDDLERRGDGFYKKSTDVPFTGKTTGQTQGTYKDGILDGPWVRYYWVNGQLWRKGDYKNGLREGPWVEYFNTGQLYWKSDFKNGERDGPWVSYYGNGQLGGKGDFKDGKKEGPWVYYNEDGTVNEELTGTYKNGKKVD